MKGTKQPQRFLTETAVSIPTRWNIFSELFFDNNFTWAKINSKRTMYNIWLNLLDAEKSIDQMGTTKNVQNRPYLCKIWPYLHAGAVCFLSTLSHRWRQGLGKSCTGVIPNPRYKRHKRNFITQINNFLEIQSYSTWQRSDLVHFCKVYLWHVSLPRFTPNSYNT